MYNKARGFNFFLQLSAVFIMFVRSRTYVAMQHVGNTVFFLCSEMLQMLFYNSIATVDFIFHYGLQAYETFNALR